MNYYTSSKQFIFRASLTGSLCSFCVMPAYGMDAMEDPEKKFILTIRALAAEKSIEEKQCESDKTDKIEIHRTPKERVLLRERINQERDNILKQHRAALEKNEAERQQRLAEETLPVLEPKIQERNKMEIIVLSPEEVAGTYPNAHILNRKEIDLWIEAAEAGDLSSLYSLGQFIQNEEKHSPSSISHRSSYPLIFVKAKAFYWWRRAQDHDDSEAWNELGRLYHNGREVKRNYTKAMECYQKAAKQNNADAQMNIGELFFYGLGVKIDYETAMEWYFKAAARNYARAQNHIGKAYEFFKKYPEALEWYFKAAHQGYASAQNHVGTFFCKGLGIKKDYIEAVEWYRKAADQGHADAQCNLGLMYKIGRGVPKDEKRAMELFKKAANQNHTDAKRMLESLI